MFSNLTSAIKHKLVSIRPESDPKLLKLEGNGKFKSIFENYLSFNFNRNFNQNLTWTKSQVIRNSVSWSGWHEFTVSRVSQFIIFFYIESLKILLKKLVHKPD